MRQKLLTLLCTIIATLNLSAHSSWVRVNQLGYQPHSIKVAVVLSQNDLTDAQFQLKESQSNRVVFTGKGVKANAKRWGMKAAFRLNFSEIKESGTFYIECNNVRSPIFRINADVYDGRADYLLKYMRQQRCGYNPYLDTLCHQCDAYIVDHPILEGKQIDVRGGWHDATDYLQYLSTSANATFQMLFAWQQTPDKQIFKDEHDAMGRKGANDIPDILDEIRWGLDWMVKMNPDSLLMFNQIADDRDHAGFRLAKDDRVDYGWGAGKGRPVYPVTGRPQGLNEHRQNRSTGVSSSAAKYASAFALGAEVFKDIDPRFSTLIKKKAQDAYAYAKKYPGNNQTACLTEPHFYEEDNWVDDVELAAAIQYNSTNQESWLKEADYWGQLEEITPWMELGRARHYQFYPFVNLGHYYLCISSNRSISVKYQSYMKKGLDCIYQRANQNDDPFMNGIPFIWCSNNLTVAAITQARLYAQASGDATYLEMEAALRDWLFGCNPWGISMVVGMPENGNYPQYPHSSYTKINGDLTYGGLIDGPIYKAIYEKLKDIELIGEDVYAPFQHGVAVYHDDFGDFSSNEPTMDGTASLTFYLSAMQKMGK